MKARVTVASLVLVTVALAGCVSPTPASTLDATSAADGIGVARPRVVVADIDTGINPYHVEFRDDSPEARQHPSTYLAGFPADVPALDLTLDAADYEAAVLADCAVWQGIESGKQYWIPGTRIVGAITFETDFATDCEDKKFPGGILDPQGHGTMTSSRIAGGSYSLCPECKLVFVQGFTSGSMLWAAQQPYIDLQTNSWGALPQSYALKESGFDRAQVLEAAKLHPVFVAGGNGLLGFFGVTGHPAYLDNIAGPDGIVMVGGHDGGRFTPWTMTMPHVVADANWHPAAKHRSLDAGDDRTGGGTSGATPFSASAFARMVLDARKLAGDVGTGVRDGKLVLAATPPAEGPMSDGDLTVLEAKTVFFHTANPRPVRDGDHDGDTCSPDKSPLGCTLYPTTPIEWGVVPTALPAYYFIGYGQVGELTLNGTMDVISGAKPLPPRPTEDQFYGLDSMARKRFDS